MRRNIETFGKASDNQASLTEVCANGGIACSCKKRDVQLFCSVYIVALVAPVCRSCKESKCPHHSGIQFQRYFGLK